MCCISCHDRLKRDLDVILLNVGNGTQDSALVNIISLLTSSIRQLLVCDTVLTVISMMTVAVVIVVVVVMVAVAVVISDHKVVSSELVI